MNKKTTLTSLIITDLLNDADFSSANVTSANFKQADLRNSKFDDSDMTGSTFFGARIISGYFNDADLRGARFHRTDFTNADFEDAKFPEGYGKLPNTLEEFKAQLSKRIKRKEKVFDPELHFPEEIEETKLIMNKI